MIGTRVVQVFEDRFDGRDILFAGGEANVGLRMVNSESGPTVFKVGVHGVRVKLQKDWRGGGAFRIEAELFKIAETNERGFMFLNFFVAVASRWFSIEDPF